MRSWATVHSSEHGFGELSLIVCFMPVWAWIPAFLGSAAMILVVLANFCKTVLNCQTVKKKAPEPRPNRARTTPARTAPEPRPNHTPPEPRPNHARTAPEPRPNRARTAPEPRPPEPRPNRARTTRPNRARTAPEPHAARTTPEPRPNRLPKPCLRHAGASKDAEGQNICPKHVWMENF